MQVALNAPNPSLPWVFGQADNLGDIISPAGLAHPGELNAMTFGAGAYTLEPSATISGDLYTYVKNPHYWNPKAQHYGKVVVKFITDPNTALEAMSSGQINVSYLNITGSYVTQAKSTGLEVATGDPYPVWVELMDRTGTVVPALANLKVREALNYAVDRPAIANVLGYGYSAWDQVYPEDATGDNPSLDNLYPYDPAKAKQLLAQAGYPNGFTIPLVTTDISGFNTVTQAVAAEWAKIGVKVAVQDDGTDLNKWVADMVGKKYAATTWNLFGDPFIYAVDLTSMTTALNPFKSTNPGLSTAYTTMATASTSQLAAATQQYNSVLTQLAWFVPLVATNSYLVASGVANLGGISSSGAIDILNWTPKT